MRRNAPRFRVSFQPTRRLSRAVEKVKSPEKRTRPPRRAVGSRPRLVGRGAGSEIMVPNHGNHENPEKMAVPKPPVNHAQTTREPCRRKNGGASAGKWRRSGL